MQDRGGGVTVWKIYFLKFRIAHLNYLEKLCFCANLFNSFQYGGINLHHGRRGLSHLHSNLQHSLHLRLISATATFMFIWQSWQTWFNLIGIGQEKILVHPWTTALEVFLDLTSRQGCERSVTDPQYLEVCDARGCQQGCSTHPPAKLVKLRLTTRGQPGGGHLIMVELPAQDGQGTRRAGQLIES